ncbi:MAG: DNA adenine methylase [Parvibaculaceae bacterium]|nr:DNA adenine methylase [Parvibaculaceae bacterium]
MKPVDSRPRGAAPYLGGKRRLAKRICERIGSIPHETYAEVFVGMGGVFFRRAFAPPQEVINDKSGEVANFFRTLEHHYQPMVDYIRWKVASRTEFDRLKNTDPALLTDIQRAIRFYYLQKLAFGGKSVGQSFGVQPPKPSNFNPLRVAEDLGELHERLAGVIVENLDYAELIRRYDKPATLFYLDPPYFGGEKDYGKGLFERADYDRMAAQLGEINGAFLLSINDVPEIRAAFAGFHMEEVRLKYSISKEEVTAASELIISNREPGSAVTAGQGSLI